MVFDFFSSPIIIKFFTMKSFSASLSEPQHSALIQESMVDYYDIPTKKKIDRHLTDINDTITEEDIRNINTNISVEILKNAKNSKFTYWFE